MRRILVHRARYEAVSGLEITLSLIDKKWTTEVTERLWDIDCNYVWERKSFTSQSKAIKYFMNYRGAKK